VIPSDFDDKLSNVECRETLACAGCNAFNDRQSLGFVERCHLQLEGHTPDT
jgi:hypothetical protein